MSDIAPDARVLEDGDDILVKQDTTNDSVEFADLNELKPGDSMIAAKPAASTVEKPAAEKPAAPAPVADDADLPQEYRGKSKAEIVKMHRDAQSLIGRQGSELGDLRQKVDFAIRASLEGLRGRKEESAKEPAKPAAPAAGPIDESEFFAKPHEAINKAIENSPLLREIRETMGRTAAEQAASRAASATERFNRAHPDAAEILNTPEFRQWVAASPIRRNLLQRAHQAYDYEAGDEVFSTWKALRGTKVAAKDGEQSTQSATAAEVSAAAATLAAARKAKADAAAKAASVPTGGTSGAGKPMAGKKIFRRADVIRLMQEDPDRYEMLADEISLAYAENRVR